jgi:hypothetical protein
LIGFNTVNADLEILEITEAILMLLDIPFDPNQSALFPAPSHALRGRLVE